MWNLREDRKFYDREKCRFAAGGCLWALRRIPAKLGYRKTDDLVISEDVLEHVGDYSKAFAEIFRILKPQGHHIFTVPVHEGKSTVSRKNNPRVIYHGDPLHEEGCAVVTDFGSDILALADVHGFSSTLVRAHCFYRPQEITDYTTGGGYEEYLQKADRPEEYFKYNSLVIDSCKRQGVQSSSMQNGGQDMKRTDSRAVFTGERFVPGIDDTQLELEHFQRYYSVLPLVKDKIVLDAACGEGYGSSILAGTAGKVTGLDICEDAVKRAESAYGLPGKLEFLVGSIEELPFPDESVDTVVSFETIEHVPEKIQQKFLKEAARVLKKGGCLIISTPNKAVYSDLHNYHNEFHIKEFYREEFLDFLYQEFQNVRLYSQYFETVCVIDMPGEMAACAAYKKEKEYQADGKYYIAVAGKGRLPQQDITHVYMNKYPEYEKRIRRILDLQDEVGERNQHIKKLDGEISRQQNHIAQLLESERSLQQELSDSRAQAAQLLESEKRQKEEAVQKQEEIQHLQQEVLNKKGHIELLLETEREYERVKASRTWRLAAGFQKISCAVLPPGSARRLAAKMCMRLIRHPGKSIKMLSPGKIRKFIRIYRESGPEFVSRRLDAGMTDADSRKHWPAAVPPVEEKSFEEYKKLQFPQAEHPDVSIIVPVYNQFSYTYHCLKAVLEHTGSSVSYEVLVADDCSADDTVRLGEITENVRIIRNQENLLFLRNCNHAAESARGRYILFLNNDTQVQENWLEPLVRLMDADVDIGMAGSKLLYADGRLQEAGGIVWDDGSAWNYGNRQEADRPEFNYVRDVDYISGASLMIRTDLWKEIGGFDQRYAPAYCEDSDLAFEVRKRGYRVVFQPKSVVVHFEGISNGTDTGSGIKQYQIENSRKLAEKWKKELKQQYPNGEHVFRARERSKNKPVILFIDHYVPHYDQDAGSKTVYQYIQMFLKKGFQVKFIGDNFCRHEPYTSDLEQLGVEVLCGSWYQAHLFEWLNDNHREIDFVFLNRPHISIKYIDYFYSRTKVKIIYYGHDLHFLRCRREYELTGSPEKLLESKDWKKQELYLMERAAVSYYPSCVEAEEIHQISPKIPVKAITAYVYDRFLEKLPLNFKEREGILFVGGFVHTPNVDAVLWFVNEIFPRIRSRQTVTFYIAGSHAPEKIQELDKKEGICVKGFVTDAELQDLYRSCRMAVIPLRYGAGVKGKVVEALYNGIPMITTSTGAEGIPHLGEIVQVEDEPEAFADAAVQLYGDFERLEQMARDTQPFVKKYFSMEAVWKVIEADFSRNESRN